MWPAGLAAHGTGSPGGGGGGHIFARKCDQLLLLLCASACIAHSQLALNEFADMTWEEFSRGRLGLTVTEEQRKARWGTREAQGNARKARWGGAGGSSGRACEQVDMDASEAQPMHTVVTHPTMHGPARPVCTSTSPRSARAAQASSSFRYGSVRNEELPQQQDWRAKGAVAEVR